MALRFPLFVDPRYNAEQSVEFEVAEVQSGEEAARSRIFAGSFKVTRVALRGGREYLLDGHFQLQIGKARQSFVDE